MTAPTASFEQFADLARRGQEAATVAVRATTSALQSHAEAAVPQGQRPVDPQAATTAAFNLASTLLGVQRQYVTTAVGLLTEAGETVTAQASAAGESLKSHTEQATERVIDLATETSRRAAASV